MIFEAVFDIETKKLFSETETGDPAELGVSIVSVYSRSLDESRRLISDNLRSFWEQDFSDMWEVFSKADRIIGFNSLNFDVPALAPYAPNGFEGYKHFDLLDVIKKKTGRRFSLNSLARDTLSHEKTDVGTNAVYYWNQGDHESLRKLREYCEADVLITRDLYDYGFTHGQLKYTDKWNYQRTMDIDFSYPKKDSERPKQGSLF
ncbi:ribonuclease H-like domain-containing protein [Patescibacteria group bacterium]|nr:ribonuclease H-like domain-containing protein [Patescibacteria group bacterium]